MTIGRFNTIIPSMARAEGFTAEAGPHRPELSVLGGITTRYTELLLEVGANGLETQPGISHQGRSIVSKSDWGPLKEIARSAPDSAFGISFFKRTKINIVIDGKRVSSETDPELVSGIAYIDAKVFPAKIAIRKEERYPKELEDLINREGWTHVVRTRIKKGPLKARWKPFREGDRVVSSKPATPTRKRA